MPPTQPQEADIYMVVGDLRPPVEATLEDRDKQPIDLTQAREVHFRARHQEKATSIDHLCEIVQPTVDPVTQLPVGKVIYNWQVGDTDQAGWYDVTFRIIWSDGTPQTAPNYTSKQLLIRSAT